MSRYPGTQFKVYDNSQATAIVPVTNVNADDTVKYLTSFASVKGPERITLTSGDDFYTRYGTQDNIDFKKYGQPLFQASMNINNGAALLAKRAVLDDATLGNATLGVVLTKYKNAKIENYKDSNDVTHSDKIGSISFSEKVYSKYSLAPIVFSIDNVNDYSNAIQIVDEYKERYDAYKDYITDVISNENTPDKTFLNKLFNKGEDSDKILSGFTQSIYYDSEDKVVDVFNDGKTSVRKVSSITTGIYNSNQKTYSSNFTIDDITGDNASKETSIDAKATINSVKDAFKDTSLWKASKDDDSGKITWEKIQTEVTFAEVFDKEISIDRIFNYDVSSKSDSEISAKLIDDVNAKHPEWSEDDYSLGDEYALIIPGVKVSGYSTTARLLNDIMVEHSGYIECEYVFPLFTIFDNGRGESVKSIGIEYDSATSVTLKKAVYSLSIYNYATAKRLEKFSFSLNPYARNNSTGYSFDIESAVNYVSEQVSVKTYYESYDALLETLQEILQSTDDTLIENNDILFGHNLNGKYPAYNSYYTSSMLKRSTYVYDYAHLDIFDDETLTVNAYCDSDNMTSTISNLKVKYYFYNYIRQQKSLLERLEMGSNGYYLGRSTDRSEQSTDAVPFIVIDDTDTTLGDDSSTISMSTIMSLTGQTNGAVISDVTEDVESSDITYKPIIQSNFIEVKVKLAKALIYKDGKLDSSGSSNGVVYITSNDKTLSRSDVISAESDDTGKITGTVPAAFSGYVLGYNSKKKSYDYTAITIWIPLSTDFLYQEQYRRFFAGEFDRDIFNLDIYFPNALFDANYSDSTKLAIQRLAAYRGDFMCYMDMGVNKISSYADCYERIPSTTGGLELTEDDNEYKYIRDMHIAVTCLSYKIRNPYDNKVISVTATYGLSNLYISHFLDDVGKVFAGISNNITINNILEGSVSYIPKIYPTSEMTSLNNIGGVYPSDDETIINEKQLMCDLRVNYGCYYDDRFSIETEYTMNAAESEFSYWNNVALVCLMMQSIRKACPSARYQFITSDDLTVYQNAVETAMKPWKNKFASISFKYVQDDTAIENKIFYAAIEVVFKPFAQAEIFELTALNYSTLSSSVTSI